MPYYHDVLYRRDQAIRDIVFFFHECAEYGTIFGDNNYSPGLLGGPYYEFFEEGEGEDWADYEREVVFAYRQQGYEFGRDEEADLLLQAGSVLLFVAMLEDWRGESGFPFGARDGEAESEGSGHPLEAYVRSLLRAWRRVRESPDHPTRLAYVTALALCAVLDRRPHLATRLDEALTDGGLLIDLRAAIHAGGDELAPERASELELDSYATYIRAYFTKRSRG